MPQANILIVDDEATNLAVFSQLLTPAYQVRACKSGEQALYIMRNRHLPDLVLLDVMMPGMDGYAVLAQLQEDHALKDIPVIFITALSGIEDEESGLQRGAVDYITKPVKPAILLARVKTQLALKQARDLLKQHNLHLEAEVARRTRENILVQNISLSVILELAETRDNETGHHITRTQAYVELLGRELQKQPAFAALLDGAQLGIMVKAAPLHDIGKIGIADRILLKPGKLDAAEWAVMQTHTTIGARTLRRALDRAVYANIETTQESRPEALVVLDVASVIAQSHHERWDGAGYPEGLAAHAIPLAARLMALADVYDALTTARVYKAAWSHEQALAYILEQRGRHFDPAVVDAFVAVQDSFIAIQQQFADNGLD